MPWLTWLKLLIGHIVKQLCWCFIVHADPEAIFSPANLIVSRPITQKFAVSISNDIDISSLGKAGQQLYPG